jgi:hypothetical protein
MNNTPAITSYQFGVLCHTAQGMAPIFPMARPRRDDKPSLRFSLRRKHEEVKQLVVMKLMEDVSDEFADTVHDHAQKTGRKFSVYGLTEVGYALFKDCDSRSIN